MLTVLSLLAMLLIGLAVGLLWHGTVLVGDRRNLDRLTRLLLAELRMEARTQTTMQAMRQAAREYGYRPDGRR